MKIMRKMALVFISVVIFSSVAYFTIGQSVLSIATEGEFQRGPGRASSVINRITNEMNNNLLISKQYADYMDILKNINDRYGEGESTKVFDIEEALKKSSVKNMLLLNGNFELDAKIKATDIDVNSDDIKEIFNLLESIYQNGDSNIVNGAFSNILSTENMLAVVACKEFTLGSDKYYNVVITPLNAAYEQMIKKSMDRTIKFEKTTIDEIPGEKKEVQVSNRIYYCISNESSVDIYTNITKEGYGPNYVAHLEDETEVRSIGMRTISTLVVMSIVVTILSNTVSYQMVKRKVLNRILDINKVVNRITNGSSLDTRIEEDREFDEISTLKSDINGMLNRLKSYSDNLEYMSSHDMLTGLLDRGSIHKYISELIANEEEFALFFVDLDNFKGINDTLGHTVGDGLLCLVTNQLEEYEKKHDDVKVGRFGGDEFILVRKGTNDIELVDKMAGEVLKLVNNTFEIENYMYEIKASMGISLYPQHAKENVNLLQYSDIAMYRSKKNGGNSYTIFSEEMLEPLNIEAKLKKAIENNELEVYYQPIYNIDKDEIIGAEALIRWNSDGVIIPPDKFISVAKKTGDILEIDSLVLKEAMKSCKEWRKKYRDDFYISINASKRFLKSKDLLKKIQKQLKLNGLDSSSIKLEITEDEVIEDFARTIEILNDVRDLGIGVYLDDFGTGYSSFNHIKTLPIDVIKIDRSFLLDIEQNNKSKSIVGTMINLFHGLNLDIVCEGVEDKEQVGILKNLECDNIQGYYFSKPLPKSVFDEFVKEFNKKD